MTLTEFLLARIAEDQERADQVLFEPHVRGLGLVTLTPRVLAECAAKREVLSESAFWEAQAPTDNERTIGTINAYRRMLKNIARAYADHPDYREEWKS